MLSQGQATLRKALLKKSQKELCKECKKYKLSTYGNKTDIVDRIMKYYSSSTSKPSISSPTGSKPTRSKRRNTTFNAPNLSSNSSNDSNISSPTFTKTTSRKSKNGRPNPRSRRSKTQVSINFSATTLKEKMSPIQQNINIESNQLLLNKFNQRFIDQKYDKLRQVIKKYNIGSNNLHQINDLTLQMLDINDENNRKEVLNEIKNMQQNGHQRDIQTQKEKRYGLYQFMFI